MSRTATRDRFPSGMRVGDYRIERELGTEETGVVYLATHVVLPRQVALKVMHADHAWLRAMAVQVIREACLLEAMSHPAVPRVYECGVLPDRRPWTAFERIDGVSISSLMASGPLAVADLVVLLRDVADLLAYTHARGVVHRRLTADAIVRTADRAYSVCVRHWDDALTLDTEARVSINARDDVHALGVIAYRALTGSQPDRSVATAERCPAASVDLASLVDHMLATDPSGRPTASEVRDRAGWLAETCELRAERPRWTPVHGLSKDAIPMIAIEESSGFSVRIGRKS